MKNIAKRISEVIPHSHLCSLPPQQNTKLRRKQRILSQHYNISHIYLEMSISLGCFVLKLSLCDIYISFVEHESENL